MIWILLSCINACLHNVYAVRYAAQQHCGSDTNTLYSVIMPPGGLYGALNEYRSRTDAKLGKNARAVATSVAIEGNGPFGAFCRGRGTLSTVWNRTKGYPESREGTRFRDDLRVP